MTLASHHRLQKKKLLCRRFLFRPRLLFSPRSKTSSSFPPKRTTGAWSRPTPPPLRPPTPSSFLFPRLDFVVVLLSCCVWSLKLSLLRKKKGKKKRRRKAKKRKERARAKEGRETDLCWWCWWCSSSRSYLSRILRKRKKSEMKDELKP